MSVLGNRHIPVLPKYVVEVRRPLEGGRFRRGSLRSRDDKKARGVHNGSDRAIAGAAMITAAGMMRMPHYNSGNVGRHAARQIDSILRGERPIEIPFYRAESFELVVNLGRDGAWADSATVAPRPCRRGDRVMPANWRSVLQAWR